MKVLFSFLLICSLLPALPFASLAGIYKYRNAQGQLSFVDDESKIPAQFRDEVTSINEAADSPIVYDAITVQKRSLAAEKIKQKDAERTAEKKQLQSYQTRIEISGNRILVPVEVTMGNRTASLLLLLDTGASRTVFHRESLAELDLPSGKQFKARVAGGGMVSSEKIKFRRLTVGPFQEEMHYAMVINLQGQNLPFDGMLGMDFLKNHPYQIDFQNQVINWQSVAED